ncbi:MAG TPA: TraR/DksA family transcriptional regulator [Flavobacteriales bacterium]|nr:TraR/DksA family transcriptional regulator [Flavobacteriales bacterium]HIO67002.1 TraR/DksA family transcriptional regulator [Flavobacteriales bacterium]
MDKKQRAEIKDLIQKQIVKTENSIEDYKEMTGPVEPDDAIGRISRMDAINNKSVVEAALRAAQRKLNDLQDVIRRVDSKNFGMCVNCKQPIPIQRIILVPQAKVCMDCIRG